MPKRFIILCCIVAAFTWIILPASAGPGETEKSKDTLTLNKDAHDIRVLPLKEFIALATQNDTVFHEILINELTLHYQKDLKLPVRDLVLSVASQMEFFLDQNREDPDTLLSLSKDFPFMGTEFEASYDVSPRFTSPNSASEMAFTISQSIAENAFGHATRLQDQLIGVEIDVARHQIFEAYEDYLGSLILAYLEWYLAYENRQIGQSSFDENTKLLDNIKERQKSKIAVPIDVNKITLQVLAKEEKLIELKERYQNRLNTIQAAIRYGADETLIPQVTESLSEPQTEFTNEYARFREDSRTYRILNLLEEKSRLEVAKEADDLLPSIDLLVGYERDGIDYGLENGNGLFFVGLSAEWPFPDQVDRAEHRIARINQDKTELSVENTHYQLHTLIKNLYQEINRERQLARIAQEKVMLAQSVLKDESENYTYGKVTLNDYIDAVNTLDNNRFNRILHEVALRKLLVDWHRLTDQLAQESQIKQENRDFYPE